MQYCKTINKSIRFIWQVDSNERTLFHGYWFIGLFWLNVKCQMSNVKNQMSNVNIRLNFCQSVPPEFFWSFFTLLPALMKREKDILCRFSCLWSWLPQNICQGVGFEHLLWWGKDISCGQPRGLMALQERGGLNHSKRKVSPSRWSQRTITNNAKSLHWSWFTADSKQVYCGIKRWNRDCRTQIPK